MPYINTAHRLYYAALNRQTGLTDVRYYVFKPNGVRLGPYPMLEMPDGIAQGIYFDDFMDADIEGNYLFVTDSPSHPKQAEQSFYFEAQVWQVSEKNSLLSMVSTIKDAEKGNWEIDGAQMIFKKEDGTELMRFNLLNEAGLPTNGVNAGAVFKRERV